MVNEHDDEQMDEDSPEWIEDYRDAPYVTPSLMTVEREYVDECLQLLLEKGVFPYSWLTSDAKLNEEALPAIEHFFNDLDEKPCEEEDYLRAISVWNQFGCRSMEDYTFIYLATDVLLLADTYESFRKLTLQDYGLDPARFHTAGALSMSAALKWSKTEVQLLTNMSMYLRFERGLRYS